MNTREKVSEYHIDLSKFFLICVVDILNFIKKETKNQSPKLIRFI